MTNGREINPKSKKIILSKLSKRERIHITSGNRKKITQKLLTAYLLLLVSSVAIYITFHGLTWKIVFISGALGVFLMLFYQVLKKVSDVSIKGEHIIINQHNYPSKIATLVSVKDVKTKRFLRFTWTNLSFNIDGNRQKIILLKKIKTNGTLPDALINFIKEAA